MAQGSRFNFCWGVLDSCQILIGPLPPRCSGRAMSTLWLLLMLIALELKLRWRWRAADKIGFLHEIGALVECDRVSQRGVLSQQTFAIEIKTLSRVVCAIGTVFGVIGFLTCACSLDVGRLLICLPCLGRGMGGLLVGLEEGGWVCASRSALGSSWSHPLPLCWSYASGWVSVWLVASSSMSCQGCCRSRLCWDRSSNP